MLLFWILLFATFATTLVIQKSINNYVDDFDVESYPYTPSSDVVDAMLEEDEEDAIRLIREETGLGLLHGKKLYNKFFTDY